MDAAETEDAAKGAGVQETASDVAETSKTEGGAEGEPVTSEKKERATLSHAEERENRPLVDDATHGPEGANPSQSSDDMDTSGHASSKRPLDTTDEKTTESHADGPPAKTTVTRRTSIRPRPNIPRDRKGGDKPQQTTDHARPTDGPGDV